MTIRTALASRWLVVLWIIAVVGLPQVSAAAPVAKFTVTPVVEQAAAGAKLVLCRGTANRHIASRGTANRGTANRGQQIVAQQIVAQQIDPSAAD